MAEKLNDLIVARTEQPAPANADKIPLLDSADAHKFRWLSWSGLLARLATLFDSTGTAAAAVAAHAANADPHPDYATSAELAGKADASALTSHAAATLAHGISTFGAGLIDDIDAGAARATLGLGSAAILNAGMAANSLVQLDTSARLPAIDGSQLTGLPSGVSAHSALTGLAADDHAQYYNQARGDARYSLTGHAHTGTYEPAGAVSAHAVAADPHPGYTTAAELATALTAKADASHTQAASTITDLAEAVDDRVAALLVAGTNVTLTYDDAAGTMTVASSGGAGYTDEQAQDAVGGILTDSATIDFTYNDAAGTITAAARVQGSISSDAAGLLLAGDAAAPGNNQLYGTNSSGVKGWYSQAAGAVQSVAGKTGVVTLAVADTIGLQTALDAKAAAIRLVTPAIATGVVAVNAANASDVIARIDLTENVSSIDPASVPTVCRIVVEATQVGGPWAFPLSAWPPGTIASSYYVYPTGKTVFWLSTSDGGTSWQLETNAPASLELTPTITAGAITVDAAGIGEVVVKIELTSDITAITRQNIPKNCRIRYEITQGAGGPWVIRDAAWGSGAIVPFYITAATGKTVITWTTADGGTTASVEGSVNSEGAIKMPAGRYIDPSVFAVGLTAVQGAAGRLDVTKFVPMHDITVDRLCVYVTVGVAAATGRVVIYGANANNEPDARLLLPADDLNLSTTATAAEHTTSFTFKKGVLYYIGFMHSSTATIHGTQGYVLPNLGLSSNASASPGCVIRQTVTYPNAPANFGFAASQITATSAPTIKMRVA
jgi:hypothetical protein